MIADRTASQQTI